MSKKKVPHENRRSLPNFDHGKDSNPQLFNWLVFHLFFWLMPCPKTRNPRILAELLMAGDERG